MQALSSVQRFLNYLDDNETTNLKQQNNRQENVDELKILGIKSAKRHRGYLPGQVNGDTTTSFC